MHYRWHWLIAAVFVFLAVAAYSPAEPATAHELAQRIVGKWVGKADGKEVVAIFSAEGKRRSSSLGRASSPASRPQLFWLKPQGIESRRAEFEQFRAARWTGSLCKWKRARRVLRKESGKKPVEKIREDEEETQTDSKRLEKRNIKQVEGTLI